MKKRILAVLCSLLLLLGALPAHAADTVKVLDLSKGQALVAATDKEVLIKGKYSNPTLPYELYGHAAIEIDPGFSGTITLQDVTINLAKGTTTRYAIRNEKTEKYPTAKRFTLQLKGKNTVTTKDCVGVRLYNPNIVGTGSLNVKTPDSNTAIFLYNASVNANLVGTGYVGVSFAGPKSQITGGSIVGTGSFNSSSSHGINVREFDYNDANYKIKKEATKLTVTGGNLTAKGTGWASGFHVYAATAKLGGQLTALSEKGIALHSRYNSTITITGTAKATGYRGVELAGGNFTVGQKGVLTAIGTATDAKDHYAGAGIYMSGGNTTFTGKVTATGSSGAYGGVGMWVGANLPTPNLAIGKTAILVFKGGSTKNASAPGIAVFKIPKGGMAEGGKASQPVIARNAAAKITATVGAGSKQKIGAAYWGYLNGKLQLTSCTPLAK